MKSRELENLGIRSKPAVRAAQEAMARASEQGLGKTDLRAVVRRLAEDPTAFASDPVWGRLAAALTESAGPSACTPLDTPVPWRNWGIGLEPESVAQMERACTLPVAVRGALMPDAHVGYGLPIGGVLATENAVVPYAVGVDIACRMRLSVLDMPAATLGTPHGREQLTRAIESQTKFGVGAGFTRRREHAVMDADWSVSPVTRTGKDRAWNQLGTSGSGNHFVEFGVLTILPEHAAVRSGEPVSGGAESGSGWSFILPPGEYLALLSHSGSRGTGAAVCDRYSKLAMELHADLPKELKQLAWLGMDTAEGQEYWAAMSLMGEYAAANHECIHRHVIRELGASAIGHVENHHNFAWKERHDPGDGRGEREVIVHRKGATPAGAGVLGVIPGSMASPGFVVRGRGSADSMCSASHGAGRRMSRARARDTFAWGNVKRELADLGVHVISAGLDEVPGVYKDIHQVMAQQTDLVEVIGRFDPRLVKMAPEGERAED